MKKDFIWGVSTAAYQIEGGENEDGRGGAIWDKAYTRGHVLGDMDGSTACDHYHRYKADVALLKELGIKNYRFSVSWSRIIPDGKGAINEAGVKFYTDLVDELIGAGITPWVTIYHWDLPRKLFEEGGFLNDRISDYFAEYAKTVVEFFGERVTNYFIFNEPQVVVEDGHYTGAHAPFLRLSRSEVFEVAHNILLCIGKSEKLMRKTASHKLNIGCAPCFTPMMPERQEDAQRALEYNFVPNGEFYDGCFFTDALIKGEFTEEYKKWFAEYGYNPSEEDLRVIKSDFDFFGVNFYRGFYVRNTDKGMQRKGITAADKLTAMQWAVTPEGIGYLAKYYYDRYKLPLVIAENGVALTEWKTLEGKIPDDMRIDYIKRHIEEIKKLPEEYPVIGYFYWTFMDNFEWGEGYSKRFGLVYVDYETQERTPKKSAYWYKKVIQTNGEDLSCD